MRLIEVEPGKPWAEVSKGKKYKPNKNFAYRLSCVALCHVMQCDVMWSALMWWAVICCDAMRCNGMASHGFVMRCGWLRCHVVWFQVTLWCGDLDDNLAIHTTKHYTVLRHTTKYYSVLHTTTNTTQYYKALLRTTRYYKVLQRCLQKSDFLLRQLFLLSHVFLWLLRSSTRVSACFFWTPVVQKGPQK